MRNIVTEIDQWARLFCLVSNKLCVIKQSHDIASLANGETHLVGILAFRPESKPTAWARWIESALVKITECNVIRGQGGTTIEVHIPKHKRHIALKTLAVHIDRVLTARIERCAKLMDRVEHHRKIIESWTDQLKQGGIELR